MKPKEDLLEALQSACGCSFLSDLHLEENRVKVIRALNTLQPENYSQEAWREAACYLLSSVDPPVRR